ncbi:MAG: ABC transporter permease [Candidatus Brocadiia bacterium]
MKNLSWIFMTTRHSIWRRTLGIVSIASSVCLLTWTAGIALTTLHQLEPSVSKTTAEYSCWIIPKSEQSLETIRSGGGIQKDKVKGADPLVISPAVVQAVKGSPLFSEVETLRTEMVRVDYRENGQVRFGPMPVGFVSDSVSRMRHYNEKDLRGRWPTEDTGQAEVAFDTALFSGRCPAIGETVALLTDTDRVDVKIVGYLRRDTIVRGFPTVFANSVVRGKVCRLSSKDVNLILCVGKEGVGRQELLQELKGKGLGGELIQVDDQASIVEGKRESTWLQFASTIPMKVGIALAFMLCMVFTNIYTGIQRRRQVFARLRGIGMSRLQLTATIIFDAMKMGTYGAVIGAAAGYLMLWVFVRTSPEIFPLGVYLPFMWTLIILGVTLLTTLLALIWPCIKVFKMRPKDFHETAGTVDHSVSWKAVIFGFILILPALILALPLRMTPDTRCMLIGWVGVPLLIIGLLFCSSLWLKIVDTAMLPLVAWLVRLDPRLLRHQITRDMGRSIGVMVTIAVGLGLYVTIEIWGASMLKPFMPSESLPDIALYALPYGVDAATWERIKRTEGVLQESFMPVLTDQLLLSKELTAKLESNVNVNLRQNNLLVVGVDPKLAFGEKAILPFDLVGGDLGKASVELQEPWTCIIVESFARHAGLSVGDTFGLRVPDDLNATNSDYTESGSPPPEHIEHLKVIGVMDMNWHMWTSRNGIRGRNGKADKTVGMVFVSYDTARKLVSPPDRLYYAWFNMTPEYRAMFYNDAARKLEADLNKLVAVPGMEIVARHRDQIVEGTIIRARGMIGAISSVPFWSLAVFSLSILNLLIAIVYERKKELGVMRAVGMTRGQFVRQLGGEIMLIWGAAVVLSLVCGIAAAWTFTGWTRALTPFSAISIEMTVPWLRVLGSILFSLAACCLMAVGPIAWITKEKPCTMIKAE